MDPSRVAQLLFSFSSRPPSPPVDSDILEYLASFELEDDDDHEQAVQHVAEICASASPAFAALPESERSRRVIAFLDALLSGDDATAPAPTDPADTAAAAAAAALAAALKDLGANEDKDALREAGGGGARRSNSTAEGDDDDSDDNNNPKADAAAVDALAGLIPADSVADRDAARKFAAHVLRRFSGDADASGEYLLSLADSDGGGGIAAAVEEHRRAARAKAEAAKREAAARERERQATLERFAWRPDSTSAGGGAGKPPPDPSKKKKGSEDGGGGGAAGGAGRIRYLDGVIVTTKGEKHVVVNQKEEWDGGSRGKVKTKGKRGVGFA